MMSRSNAAVERATSVSSSRNRKVPPTCRAYRKLNSAVRAVPMWSGPVGLGAIRTRIVGSGMVESVAAAAQPGDEPSTRPARRASELSNDFPIGPGAGPGA